MEPEIAALDRLQTAYQQAVERWIAAIRKEAAMASVTHTLAEVDAWEQAHFDEDTAREAALSAKDEYENALRQKFFNF
jgi:hypothetical protein